MSTIKIKCNDQVMTFENTPVISSGGLEENSIEFSFCAQWDGFARTAVFWRSENEAYHVVLDENDSGPVPSEVTAEPGVFYFGVFGVNADQHRRTTEVLNYRVTKGTITENTKPPEATPEIYDQLLAKYAEVLVALDPAEGMVREAAASAAAAEDAARSVEGQVSAANSAAGAAQTAATEAQASAAAAATSAKNAENSAASAAPAEHASNHATGGSDPITLDMIGAAAAKHVSNHATGGSDPLTPGDIGAFPAAGGQITGNLMVYKNIPAVSLEHNTQNSRSVIQNLGHSVTVGMYDIAGSTSNARTLYIRDSSGTYPDLVRAVELYDTVNGTSKFYRLLHEGNMEALGAVRIKTGSYEGTGANGTAAKNSLTFPFVPKLVIVTRDKGLEWCVPEAVNGGRASMLDGFIWINGITKTWLTNGSEDEYDQLRFSLSDKTLTWHTSLDATAQCNDADRTYYWVAIG